MYVSWFGKQPKEYEVRGNRWLQTDGGVQGNDETVLTSMINNSFQHVGKKKKTYFGGISAKHFSWILLEMLSQQTVEAGNTGRADITVKSEKIHWVCDGHKES